MPNPNRQARYPRDLVKLLNENIDLDALVFDTDASGNPIVVDSKSGDTIAFYDRDTGEWNLSDINIQSLDADSVNTGSATVTNQVDAGSLSTDKLLLGDITLEQIATDVDLSGSSSVDISVGGYRTYWIDYYQVRTGGVAVLMRLDNDSSQTYNYWDQTGTNNSGETEWQLWNASAAAEDGSGRIELTNRDFNVGMNNNFAGMRDRFSSFTISGAFDNAGDPSTVTFFTGDGSQFNLGTVDVYGVVEK